MRAVYVYVSLGRSRNSRRLSPPCTALPDTQCSIKKPGRCRCSQRGYAKGTTIHRARISTRVRVFSLFSDFLKILYKISRKNHNSRRLVSIYTNFEKFVFQSRSLCMCMCIARLVGSNFVARFLSPPLISFYLSVYVPTLHTCLRGQRLLLFLFIHLYV